MSLPASQRRLMVGTIAALVFAASALLPSAALAAPVTTHWVNDDKPVVVGPGQSCNKPGYNTIQAAVTAAAPGDTVRVCAGTYAGAVIDREVHVRGMHGATINDGPFSHPGLFRAAFLFNLAELPSRPGSGSTIEGFRIVGAPQFTPAPDDGKLDFGVFSRGADDVTVQFNAMSDMLQGITDWNGTDWNIRFNAVKDLWTRNGGGIGILVGGFDGVTAVTGNQVSHNAVFGTVQVDPADAGGYDASGIVMYSDHRFGRPGALSVSDNTIERNLVHLESDTPETVDVNDLELTVAGSTAIVMTDNEIDRNRLGGEPRNGILVSEGTANNLFTRNRVHDATEFSCRDDSVGAGTEGTANYWFHNRADTPSSPPGICDDHGHEHDDD